METRKEPELVLAPDVERPIGLAKRAKRSVLTSFGAAGGFHLCKHSRWRQNRLLILAYHGISLRDEHLWDPAMFLTPEKFARRLDLLERKGYSVVTLDEGLRRLAAGDLPPASVAITFDDGMYNFHRAALPILERFGFPATLYLTTFYSDFQEPVFDGLSSYMLWKSRTRKLDMEAITGARTVFNLADENQRTAARRAILDHAAQSRFSAVEKAGFSERLASHLSFDLDGIRRSRLLGLMTPDEVADASMRGVSIELHTHRHRLPLDRGALFREIDDNRMRIERITGRTPRHFCYPSGYFNPTVVPWLQERGIVSAATCEPGLTSRNTDCMSLPRLVDVSALGESEFEGWLSGASAVLPQRSRRPATYARREAAFIDRAREICRSALLSPPLVAIHSKLDESAPANMQEAWLRELWTQGTFPAPAQAALAEAAKQCGDLPFSAERALLLNVALRALDRLTDARLDLSTQGLVCSQYEFFAAPGERWQHRFDPTAHSYRVYAGMALLQRFPAGRFDWEISGIPLSWIPKVRRRDLPRLMACIGGEIRAFKPLIDMHMAYRQSPMTIFLEKDVRLSYLRITRNLALRPELKGIMTASWLYSAETHRVSPHLNWTTRLFEENGGIVTDLGPAPEDSGFLEGSNARRALYQSGAYKPTLGLIVWPRRAALDWLSKQPDKTESDESRRSPQVQSLSC
jgi:peptidoglycan/xylan/chitin deacetylase (PgdA/CDA1 family)